MNYVKNKKYFIPVIVVAIMVLNVLVAKIYNGLTSFAIDEQEPAKMSINTNYDDPNNIKINLGGNFESEITSIKYTDGGKVSKDQVMDYFNNSKNNIVDVTDQNQGISPNVLAITIENAKAGKDYTILVTFSDGTARVAHVSVANKVESIMQISYKYSDSNLTINVTSNLNNIEELKIAKSSEISQDSDFENKGKRLEITSSTDITKSYTINEEGTYKIYAKDSKGKSMVQETKYFALKTDKKIEIETKNDNKNTLIIKGSDSAHKIVVLKVIESSERLSAQNVKESGKTVEINADKNVTVEYESEENSTYIFVYIEDEYGYSYTYGITKNALNVEENNNGEQENNAEENKAENKEEKQEENKTENKEENKEEAQEQKKDEDKEDNKEENKSENNQDDLGKLIVSVDEENSEINNIEDENKEIPTIEENNEVGQEQNQEENKEEIQEQKQEENKEVNNTEEKQQENEVNNNTNESNQTTEEKNITENNEREISNKEESESNNKEKNEEITTENVTSIYETNQASGTHSEAIPNTGVDDTKIIVLITIFEIIALIAFLKIRKINKKC